MQTTFVKTLIANSFLLVILGLVFIYPNSISAAQSLEVSPAYVDVTLAQKGSEQEIPITYTNHTAKPLTLELFPIDFRQSNLFGDIGFVEEGDSYSYSLSSFLSFETKRVDLSPGQKKIVTLKALNRQDLSPGGHYAAVIARQVQDNKETTISPAVSTLIFLRKTGGEQFHLSLVDFSFPGGVLAFSYPSTLTALFQNEGNVHLVPHGTVEVRDLFGRLLYEGTVNENSVYVLPESRRYVAVYLKSRQVSLPISFNTVVLKGQDSLHKTTYLRRDSYLYINPFVLLVLIVAGGYLVYKKRKSKRS